MEQKHSASDAAEFARIFKNYYARLCHFSFQLTGDRQLAEDICQEAFIRYWDHREHISPIENAVKNYLYATVRNTSVSSLRHKQVAQRYRNGNQMAETDDITIIHAIIRSEITAEIYNALNTLPEGCREVVNMAYLEDMKNKEIALYSTGDPENDYFKLFGFDNMSSIDEMLLYRAPF